MHRFQLFGAALELLQRRRDDAGQPVDAVGGGVLGVLRGLGYLGYSRVRRCKGLPEVAGGDGFSSVMMRPVIQSRQALR